MQQSSEVAAVAGTVKAAAGPDASGGPAPPVSDITPEESEECRAPGRSPPRLMVFQGPRR